MFSKPAARIMAHEKYRTRHLWSDNKFSCAHDTEDSTILKNLTNPAVVIKICGMVYTGENGGAD